MIVQALLGAVVLFFAATLSLTFKNRLTVSKMWLWAALIAPMCVGVVRNLNEVQSIQLGAADAIRGGVPPVCLVIGCLLARPVRRGGRIAQTFMIMFIAWAALSSTWSPSTVTSLLKVFVLAVEFAALAALARRYGSGNAMLRATIGLAHLLLGTVAVGLVVKPSLAWQQLDTGTQRLSGAWPSLFPNVLGIVAMVAILALVARVGPCWTTRMPMSFLLGAVEFVMLLAARSRLALAVTVAMCAVILLRSVARRRGSALALGFGIAAALGMYVLFSTTIMTFFTRGQTDQQVSSLTGRLPLWQNALRVWDRQRLTGFGYYTGHRIEVPPVAGSGTSSNLDNMWVELLVDVGIIGAAIMACAVLAGVWVLVRESRDRDMRDFAFAVGTAFLLATSFNPSIQLVGFIGLFFGLLLFAHQPQLKRDYLDVERLALSGTALSSRRSLSPNTPTEFKMRTG